MFHKSIIVKESIFNSNYRCRHCESEALWLRQGSTLSQLFRQVESVKI